jgi:CheY-like chemotaxis protein
MGFLSARAALAALEKTKPDLIVSDILMPELDGLAFARIVRRLHGVPLMFVSIAKKQAEAVILGAVGYVQKPASALEIRSAVERVLVDPTRRNTILVVDDEPDVCDLYLEFLSPGFHVLTAANGRDALDILHKVHVDLAIVDVNMPIMNGAELVRAVRSDPKLEMLPVVVQTNDPTALRAPVWATLRVSKLMDKTTFVEWFESQLEPPATRELKAPGP